MRGFYFALLALFLGLPFQSLMATTYYVGSCRANAFSSINAAVTTVPAGSIIDVCPGTYAEQVVISKALTLQGININNSSQAVITVPSGGLTETSSLEFGAVAAQVEITAGPVNITNITVDGTAGIPTCPPVNYYIGIFYSSGSSGTVNRAETRNQTCGNFGFGMLAENGVGAVQSVKIQNSSVHDNTYAGIYACSNQTPSTLTTTITGNYVAGANNGIFANCNTGGVVSGNTVAAGQNGVLVLSTSTAISANTLTGGSNGIYVGAAASVTSNHIFNIANNGIILGHGSVGATIKSNTITKATSGVGFNCNVASVTGNTIIGVTTGFDYVPSAFSGANKFYNVATVNNRESCP